MKLIDADKLYNAFEEYGDFTEFFVRQILNMIEEQEVIEAIPYSKLKEWQNHYGNKCTYGHIMKLIDEWREENE